MLPIIAAINDESDRDFVEDIYNKYGKKMYLVAFGILKKKVDAEDCVHDVIKIIIDNIERFRNADYNHLINLIVKCTRNDAINKYNKEKKKREIETDFHIRLDADGFYKDIEIELADNSEHFDNILINEENKKRLAELISGLDDIYRDVLYLKYQMFMSNFEISKLLSVSENVVNFRLCRAKKILLKTRSEELYELRKN